MRRLVPVLLAVIASLVLSPLPAVAQDVGVTAAVNQSAKGTRSGGVRTIALGDNVVRNERIETSSSGLVQILLVDGTTFTVGPNSSMVIDSFVYDPNAGTASVAATLTKGVFRFIGGATSKTEGGVKLDTPVGTVGIRGAVTDINLNPPGGIPPHVSLIFGNEVTLSQGQDLLGRLYQGGYSLAFDGNGNINVIKTPPEWASQIQSALSGAPGTNGGANGGPTNNQVAGSGVGDENSGNGVGANTPDPGLPPLSPEEIAALLLAIATYDELKQYVIPHQPEVRKGFSTGTFAIAIGEHTMGIPILTTTAEGDFLAYLEGHDIDPYYTEIVSPGSDEPVLGLIDLGNPVCDTDDCRVRFVAGTDGVTANITLAGIEYPLTVADFELTPGSEVMLPEGAEVCECEGLNWGTWSSILAPPNAELPGSLDPEYEIPTFEVGGLWVVGDLVTASDLTDLASTTAYYSGTAIGQVTSLQGQYGSSAYLATGALDLEWSFGSRSGVIAITDFDGRDLYGQIAMGADSTAFSGAVTSGGLYSTFDEPMAGGVVKGTFANNGSDVGAGVLGDFFALDGQWLANGIFMGERSPAPTD